MLENNPSNVKNGATMVNPNDCGGMGKEDRRKVVLDFMREYDVALRPAELYRNLRYHRQITFSKESVDNYLEEFVEEGLALRVKPTGMDAGKIEEAPQDKRAYYIITDDGRKYLESGR